MVLISSSLSEQHDPSLLDIILIRLEFSRLTPSLVHVIFGLGKPSAIHVYVILSPFSFVALKGVLFILGATFDDREREGEREREREVYIKV